MMDVAAANRIGKKAITRFFRGDVPTIVNNSVGGTSSDNVAYTDGFAKSAIMTDLGHLDWSPMDLGKDKDETPGVIQTETTTGLVDHTTRSFALSKTEGDRTTHFAARQDGNELQTLTVDVDDETGQFSSEYRFYDREDPERMYSATVREEWLFAGEAGSKPGAP